MVVFVHGGTQVRVAADVLSAMSRVWRERLQIAAPANGAEPRSEETVDPVAFASLLCWFTQDGRDDAYPDLATITRALPLVHKYDCPSILRLRRLDEARTCTCPDSMRLSADMMEYVLTKQELWGPDELNDAMIKFLAQLVPSMTDATIKRVAHATFIRMMAHMITVA
jgi:hypothetical protein